LEGTICQHRLAGAQFPHAPLKTRARHYAHLQPEAAQNASDAELNVQQFAEQLFARHEQCSHFL
jgi:hypothetical protein